MIICRLKNKAYVKLMEYALEEVSIKKMKSVKLNLACGEYYLGGYTNIDNNSHGNYTVDKKADIFDLSYEEDSVDEILLSHFMMYVDRSAAPAFLKKLYGWLKPRGILVVETGDLKYIAKNILNTDNPDIIEGKDGVTQLFGWDGSAEGRPNSQGHKWAWCPETLEPLFIGAGFSETIISRGKHHDNPERDFIIKGIK